MDFKFEDRHIGSNQQELLEILQTLGVSSLEELIKSLLPSEIYNQDEFCLEKAISEQEFLQRAQKLGNKNKVFKNYIGMGYNPSITPSVILRNVLENPNWYTSYTPYQPEISQGRLEALLNFQTLITDLTGMELANASLLDESTAAAEALNLAKNANESLPQATKFFVDKHCFPQTLEVLKTRSKALGWQMELGDFKNFKFEDKNNEYFATIIQYPNSLGSVEDISHFIENSKKQNCISIVITDPLSLCLLKPPGEMGSDVVVGSSQRFGIPLFFGGPHAAFIATKEKFVRLIPGRIVGVSKDRHAQPALRLALQTREQHIKRERATSNICTAQALLATAASFYACYHGPLGLKKIASKINYLTKKLYTILELFDWEILNPHFFDTLTVSLNCEKKTISLQKLFWEKEINISSPGPKTLSWSLNEQTTEQDIAEIKTILQNQDIIPCLKNTSASSPKPLPTSLIRTSLYLEHPVFNSHHTETKMMRYIKLLEKKELSLTDSMIPLGSCTMKLNAATEMIPISWSSFNAIHPFAPKEQTQGFLEMIKELEQQLCELTGFYKFSFQGNAGSQGEYAGLLAIKSYHKKQGDTHRDICLIPTSAHGTNPASAMVAGLKVQALACTKEGSIDKKDLQEKLKTYSGRVACLMLTYPSTYGIFEEDVKQICSQIHQEGGLVYLDGANMNALLGLCKVAHVGFDVCHLNLHKTFCIPHGGGGPGVGPIGVNKKLKDFLPSHWFYGSNASADENPSTEENRTNVGAISSAPYGSAGILSISWAYILMMGHEGLKKSAGVAIANANYIAEKLKDHYKILFTGHRGGVAHECIVDFRKFKNTKSITIDDIAKRLIDYGFHAPTMSWPVPGTLMIEPTESESKQELDKFCEALISIKKEIELADVSLLKNAPHVLEDALSKDWQFPYSKQQAFYPLAWVKKRKYWPPVSRVQQAYGDINLVCSCPSMRDFE